MKNYLLIEKAAPEGFEVKWLLQSDGLTYHAKAYGTHDSHENAVIVGYLFKETKRGWTIRCNWLTSKPVDVFLPRENFDKIEFVK